MKWTEELINKIQANRSPIVFVVTNDKLRFTEMCFALQQSKISREIFVFDGWRGLSKFQDGNLTLIDIDCESADPSQAIYSQLYSPSEKKNNIVIMKNFDESFFLRFFHYIASDFKLFLQKSYLIVVVDDFTAIPSSLIDKVNIIDVVTSFEDRKNAIAIQLERINIKDNAEELASILSGLNLDQTEASIVSSIIEKHKIDREYLMNMKKEIFARKGNLTLLDSDRGFESIGGYKYIKDFLVRYVITPCKNPALAKEFGVEIPKGILLFGIEGTGKTILAKALGKELSLPVVQFHSAQYRSKYFGETEQRVKSAIKSIKELSPCIIFIDEIEHLGYRPSGETDSGTSQNVFTMLLSFMSEEHKSIIIGTTNKIESLDPAFMRAGRIDFYIPQMLPDAEARKEIFKVHTTVVRHIPVEKDIDIEKIISKTHMWNGAEIELLIKTASTIAFNDVIENNNKKINVTIEHFNEAFKERHVDIEKRTERMKLYYKIAKQLCNESMINEAFKTIISSENIDYTSTIKEVIK